jgi:Putative citrate transport
MILILPLLHANGARKLKPCSGLLYFSCLEHRRVLTPLGDPSLFLGYLHGTLWPRALLIADALLAAFFLSTRIFIGGKKALFVLTLSQRSYQIQRGFVQRTPRGRVLTSHAFRHLGLKEPAQEKPQLGLFAEKDRE